MTTLTTVVARVLGLLHVPPSEGLTEEHLRSLRTSSALQCAFLMVVNASYMRRQLSSSESKVSSSTLPSVAHDLEVVHGQVDLGRQGVSKTIISRIKKFSFFDEFEGGLRTRARLVMKIRISDVGLVPLPKMGVQRSRPSA